MRAKLTLLSALAVGILGGVIAAGCQTYDFEPVEPLALSQTTEARRIEARERKPNLMLLVDTSGSMKDPVDVNDPNCRVNGNVCGVDFPCNTAICPTRWSALQDAMRDFLTTSGTLARMGLTTYPTNDLCGATSSVVVELPGEDQEDDDTLMSNAQAVWNRIFSIKNQATNPGETEPQGGTPTSESLRYLGSLSSLQSPGRSNFVLLLTDGLPNCNENHPTPYPSSGCFCTLSSCSFVPELGCLDDLASVKAAKELRDKNIKTIVVGFGADFDASGDPNSSGARGAATLNAMALAGDFPFERQCSVDADCGSDDTCDTSERLCRRRFYMAINKDDLLAALRQITERIDVGDPCLLRFEADQLPSSQDLVVVYVNKERLDPGANTWNLTEAGVQFNGTTCQRIQNSTSANPVDIEVRAVQRK